MPTAAQPQRIALQSEHGRRTRCSLQDQPLAADASFQHSLETVQIFASDARCFASRLSSPRGAALRSHPPKVPQGTAVTTMHGTPWDSEAEPQPPPKQREHCLLAAKCFCHLLFSILFCKYKRVQGRKPAGKGRIAPHFGAFPVVYSHFFLFCQTPCSPAIPCSAHIMKISHCRAKQGRRQ